MPKKPLVVATIRSRAIEGLSASSAVRAATKSLGLTRRTTCSMGLNSDSGSIDDVVRTITAGASDPGRTVASRLERGACTTRSRSPSSATDSGAPRSEKNPAVAVNTWRPGSGWLSIVTAADASAVETAASLSSACPARTAGRASCQSQF